MRENLKKRIQSLEVTHIATNFDICFECAECVECAECALLHVMQCCTWYNVERNIMLHVMQEKNNCGVFMSQFKNYSHILTLVEIWPFNLMKNYIDNTYRFTLTVIQVQLSCVKLMFHLGLTQTIFMGEKQIHRLSHARPEWHNSSSSPKIWAVFFFI